MSTWSESMIRRPLDWSSGISSYFHTSQEPTRTSCGKHGANVIIRTHWTAAWLHTTTVYIPGILCLAFVETIDRMAKKEKFPMFLRWIEFFFYCVKLPKLFHGSGKVSRANGWNFNSEQSVLRILPTRRTPILEYEQLTQLKTNKIETHCICWVEFFATLNVQKCWTVFFFFLPPSISYSTKRLLMHRWTRSSNGN